MRIIDELVGFCFKRGCTNVDININFDDKKNSIINLKGTIKDLPIKEVETLNKLLNLGRQEEMEECYWLLTGDDSFGDELTLIASMIDKCVVAYENNVITLTVYRSEH